VITAARRLLTVPVAAAVDVLLLAGTPLLAVLAVALCALTRSSRPVRSVAVLACYAAIDLRTLARLLTGPVDSSRLLPELLSVAYRALRVVLDVHVVLADGSVPRGGLDPARPLLVLARHCGPGDTLYIAWLLAVHYRLRLRIVLKSVLRLQPTLDLAADHLPLCFVGRRGRGRALVHGVASSMTGGDALLLFPEGGNFTWSRWHEALRSLSAEVRGHGGPRHALRRALRRTHTLPPHQGGVTAALAGSPRADVLLLAHAGFTTDGRDRPWWQVPVHRPFLVRTSLIPAATVPRETAARRAWLESSWTWIDSWVAGHTTDAAPPSRTGHTATNDSPGNESG
jgi:1-acyl-sn-glycerol-3-phosphate acyltransferase